MVIDPQFPTCPIRNVLSRLCGLDALWVILVLAERVSGSMEQLCWGIVGMKHQQVASAVRFLMEDHLVEKSSGVYRLSPLGQSVLPYVKELVGWCEMQSKC